MLKQQEENSPTTENQSQGEISGKTVSNAREGETVSHEEEAERFPAFEPEVEKEASSEKENLPTSSQVEFRTCF